ncbi:type II secretion system protein [bacterium]|nr:type II secretion system protein [bacterium]MCK4437053.1 type II secretion system protein [bacterium]
MRKLIRSKGFTLLEIVIALAILVIGLVGVLALFPTGLRASKRAGDFTTAAILGQQRLESIKRAGYSLYSTDGWYNWDVSGETEANAPAQPFPDQPDFSWNAEVTDTTFTPDLNLKGVNVIIYWQDRGQTRSENFFTYLADYS